MKRYSAPKLFLVLVLTFAVSQFVRAGQDQRDREATKAGFLVGFLDFVTFLDRPHFSQDGLKIGVVNSAEFAEKMRKTARVRRTTPPRIEIIELSHSDYLQGCRIVYLGQLDPSEYEDWVRTCESMGILSVSDFEGFAASGGIIEFTGSTGKIRFKINTDAARRSRLKISSKLMRLAVR